MHRAHAQQQPRRGNSITNLSDMNFITERFPAASHKLHEVAHSFPQAFHPNVLPTLPWGAEGTGAGLTSVGLVVGMSVTPPGILLMCDCLSMSLGLGSGYGGCHPSSLFQHQVKY